MSLSPNDAVPLIKLLPGTWDGRALMLLQPLLCGLKAESTEPRS